MKTKILLTLVITSMIIIVTLITYYLGNIIPKKTEFIFSNTSNEKIINEYNIENKNGRIAIFFSTSNNIFKHYKFHRYISGDGEGKKIFLKMYLISEDKSKCYQIKSICYDYDNQENLKFLGYYYTAFIDNTKKYSLAVFVPDTNTIYNTYITV